MAPQPRTLRPAIRSPRVTLTCFLILAVLATAPAAAEWKIESPDGESSIRFGFLAQARAEVVDTADGEDTSQDLFLRRLRLIATGKLSERWSFFIETDSPNLGKSDEDIFLQDVILTYRRSDAFHLDLGLLLTENSYNGNQGAVNLMAADYGPYSFLNSGPLDERIGRDVGARLRGYLAGGRLEYRAGVYQGLRGDDATNSLRFLGRLTYNVFDAQKGYFYQGTSLGKKKILAFGASFDTQEGYDATGVDAYLDLPVGMGDAVTFQVDWVRLDGGDFLAALPEQDTLLVELGYYFSRCRLQPHLQYATRDFDRDALADQESFQAGLSWMMAGHHRNLKLSWTRLTRDGFPDRDQLWLTFQAFVL
jgi:hypothetical protein